MIPVEGIENLWSESHAVARGNQAAGDEEGAGGRVSLNGSLKVAHHHTVIGHHLGGGDTGEERDGER